MLRSGVIGIGRMIGIYCGTDEINITGDIMKRIEIKDHASLEDIASEMKNKHQFIIITDDKNFNPLGYDKHSAEIWVGALGGGLLVAVGGGAILLAFLDPEPTTKLGLLIGGGTIMALCGGGIFVTILITRSRYSSIVSFNTETKKYEWILTPRK
jgi:hypothetical protein